MENEAALRSSMVALAAVILAVGLWTHSLKKTAVTYVVGMVLIGGVLLPDWDFFDRDFSRWVYPVTAEERLSAQTRRSGKIRFRFYPLRTAAYSTIYGFVLYKWWMFISS